MGAWNRPRKHVVSSLQSKVERSLNLFTAERSTALSRILRVGPALDIDYNLDFAVLRHLKWKHGRNEEPDHKRWRIREVFEKYQIGHIEKDRYQFPNGTIEMGWDSEKTIHAMFELAWHTRCFWEDKRGADKGKNPEVRVTGTGEIIHFNEQKKSAKGQTRNTWQKASLMASWDGRRLANEHKINVKCWCGADNPKRRHMTWECPWFGDLRNAMRLPQNASELSKKLGVEKISDGMGTTWRERQEMQQAIEETTQIIKRAPIEKGRIIIATDGGSKGKNIRHTRASWAVTTKTEGTGGVIHGADRTSAAGERWAAYVALKAIEESRIQKPIVMLIDNLSVCDELIRLNKRGWKKPGQCANQWKDMFESMEDMQIEFYWVPSHRKAKNASWRPMREFNDEDMEAKAEDWRDRNQKADDIATTKLDEQLMKVEIKMLDEKQRDERAHKRINMLYQCSCALERRVQSFKAIGRTDTWGINIDNPNSFMSTLAVWNPHAGGFAEEADWRDTLPEQLDVIGNSDSETDKWSDSSDSDSEEGTLGVPDSDEGTDCDRESGKRETKTKIVGGVDVEEERRQIREGLERLRQAKRRRDDSREVFWK